MPSPIRRLVAGIATLRPDDPALVAALRLSARLGADLSWQKRLHLRGGYIFDVGEAGGPSLGVGLSAGSLNVDIARLFEGLSADAGQAPTYLSLSYLF